MIHIENVKKGLVSAIPICVTFSLIFFSMGLVAHSKGLTLFEAALMTASIFAAPSQSYILDNQNAAFWAIALNVGLINFKFILMSTVLVSLWKKSTLYTIISMHFMSSSSFLLTNVQKNIKDPWSFYLAIGITSYCVAVLSTMIGHHAWHSPENIKTFMISIANIVLPIHFVCLTIKRRGEHIALTVSLLGFMLAPLLYQVINKNLAVVIWFIIAAAFVKIEEYLKDHASDK